MIINHNIAALNTYNRMVSNEKATQSSLAKLSSGLRINSAADDAAGLAISEKMRGQIRGLNQATSNAQDTQSLLQTAEGGLNETQSILQRMRELAVQASNDTNMTADRTALQTELGQLTTEVDRIANTTEFNTKKLLNGDLAGATDKIAGQGVLESTFANGSMSVSFSTSALSRAGQTDVIHINVVGVSLGSWSQAVISKSSVLNTVPTAKVIISSGGILISTTTITGGQISLHVALKNPGSVSAGDTITISLEQGAMATNANKSIRAEIGANSGQSLEIGIGKMDSTTLGIRQTNGKALDITTQKNADGAVFLINNAIQTVSIQRSQLGAYENRLDHTVNNLTTSSQNLTSAESRIRDVDMASEMTNFQKNNVLQQAAQAMLAQANQLPQGVLQLLK